MKTKLYHWLAPSVLLASCADLTACGGPPSVPMVGSPRAPAAQGSVIAEPTANGNTRIVVDVRHMAQPDRIAPDAKVYVVWVKPAGAPPQNVGALRVDEHLNGRLETVTAHPSFEVIVTPEQLPSASVPSGPQILSAVIGK